MIKAKIGQRLDAVVRALFPFLFTRRLDPNALTIVGTLVCVAAAAAFALGSFPLAGGLMLLGGFFDLIDGVVARHHGISTRFGAFLDSTLDRLADMAILFGIATHFAIAGEPGNVLLAGAALISTVLVSYAQARAEVVLPDFKVGILERAERWIILTVGALSGFVVVALWIVAIGSTVTFFQRFVRAYRDMGRLDADERVERVGERT